MTPSKQQFIEVVDRMIDVIGSMPKEVEELLNLSAETIDNGLIYFDTAVKHNEERLISVIEQLVQHGLDANTLSEKDESLLAIKQLLGTKSAEA